ncbi:MAG: PfkB family carbohydrate kinase [Thermomicrobiales bacterium]
MGPSGEVVEADWKSVEIVDRLGGGDSFAGGFISGYLADPENLHQALTLGVAASSLKHTMPGDFLCATRDEIIAAAGETAEAYSSADGLGQLHPLTVDNWEDAARLEVDASQTEYIETNLWSIAELQFYPSLSGNVIVARGTVVGFLVWD